MTLSLLSGRDTTRTYTITEGESWQFVLRSGETLENLLIDITADDADAQIVADGTDWTIRNVGFKGKMDRGANNDGYPNCIKPDGSGRIENVYMGGGTHDGIRAGGIGIPSSNSGHIDIVNCHFAEWSDNAIYNSNAADNGGGTVGVDSCYFRDNNVAHLRIAADGSWAKNCVIHNTGKTPELPDGSVDATGVYTGYGDETQTVEIHNCDIDCTVDNRFGEPFWSNDGESTIEVKDSEFVGDPIGNVVVLSGNGQTPDLTPPDGVPMDAEEAASGSRA